MLTRQEVADRLKVSVRAVDRLRASGKLPAVRVGGCVRFTEKSLDDYIEDATDRQTAPLRPAIKIRDYVGEIIAASEAKRRERETKRALKAAK